MMFLNPCSDSKPKQIRVLGAFQVLAIRTNRPAKSCKLKIKVAPHRGHVSNSIYEPTDCILSTFDTCGAVKILPATVVKWLLTSQKAIE